MSSTGGPPIAFLQAGVGSVDFLTLQSLFAVDDVDVLVVLLLLVRFDAAVWLICVPLEVKEREREFSDTDRIGQIE